MEEEEEKEERFFPPPPSSLEETAKAAQTERARAQRPSFTYFSTLFFSRLPFVSRI